MSSLFANLSSRARGTAMAVRPRLPSVFETAVSDGGLEEAPIEAPPALPPSAAAGSSVWAPARVSPPGRRGAAEPDGARDPGPRRETIPPPPPGRMPALRLDTTHIVPAPASLLQSAPRSAAQPGPAAIPLAATPPPRPSAAAEPAAPVIVATVRDRVEPPEVQPGNAPRPQAAILSPRAPLPAAGLSTAPRSRNRSPPPPPVIEVSIGRIEVRFEAPSSPPRRAAEPSPVMSLGDYLRSRRDGARGSGG